MVKKGPKVENEAAVSGFEMRGRCSLTVWLQRFKRGKNFKEVCKLKGCAVHLGLIGRLKMQKSAIKAAKHLLACDKARRGKYKKVNNKKSKAVVKRKQEASSLVSQKGKVYKLDAGCRPEVSECFGTDKVQCQGCKRA